MLRVGGSGRHGDGSLSGFIGHQPPLDALGEHCAKSAAKTRFRPKRAAQDGSKKEWDLTCVKENQYQYYGNIQQCHDGYQSVCPAGNTSDSAENNSSGEKYDHNSDYIRENRICGDDASGNNLGHAVYRGDYIKSLGGKAAEGIEEIEE